ncbi:hypothetical protein RRG08_016081 [Elysia crispata]|uniref:Uncharacterized protein n=1 Tax=Elysia crispata TaxID=231223 RepID=A0AAE0ZNG4_9GAST|nr:hypothetical protein RRG08_016081 [Elysia crispata]
MGVFYSRSDCAIFRVVKLWIPPSLNSDGRPGIWLGRLDPTHDPNTVTGCTSYQVYVCVIIGLGAVTVSDTGRNTHSNVSRDNIGTATAGGHKQGDTDRASNLSARALLTPCFLSLRLQVLAEMEKARPSRSSIPILADCHPVDPTSHRQHHVYSTPQQGRPGGGEERDHQRRGAEHNRYHSPSRKNRSSNGRHSSPKPPRNAQHLHGNTHDGKPLALNAKEKHRRDQNCSANVASSAHLPSCDQPKYASPRHRPPTGRAPALCVQPQRQTDAQDELLERSVVGCESGSDPYADPADLTAEISSGHFSRPDGQETITQPEHLRSVHAPAGCSQTEDFSEAPMGDKHQQASGPPSGTAVSHITQAPEVVGSGDACSKIDSVCFADDGNVPVASIPEAEPTYPIRGTISPLSSCTKMAVKRSVGPVDEVSFVFGRPDSPSAEGQFAVHYSAPLYSNNGYSRSRCISPAGIGYGARGFSRKSGRPRSPNSDVLPQRRGVEMCRDSRRVLSPPPVLGVGSAAEARLVPHGRACCDHCNGCLVELKRQALRLMFPDTGADGHLAQVGS